jgi:chemotaxis protein CheC
MAHSEGHETERGTTMQTTELDEAALATRFTGAMVCAGEALAEMSGRPIRIATPSVRPCSPDEVVAMAGGPEAIVVGVYLGVSGGLQGHALLVLEPGSARRLAALLLDGLADDEPAAEPEAGQLGELERSALGEIGNVTISAFLNEIGRRSANPIQPTPPQVVVEMAGAIVDGILLDLLGSTERVLAAHTVFHDGDDRIHALLLVLPDPARLPELLADRPRPSA